MSEEPESQPRMLFCEALAAAKAILMIAKPTSVRSKLHVPPYHQTYAAASPVHQNSLPYNYIHKKMEKSHFRVQDKAS